MHATAVLLHGMMMRLSTLQLYMCGDQALLVLRMHTIYFIQLKLSLYELLIDIRVHFVRVVATTEPMAIHPRYRYGPGPLRQRPPGPSWYGRHAYGEAGSWLQLWARGRALG